MKEFEEIFHQEIYREDKNVPEKVLNNFSHYGNEYLNHKEVPLHTY